MSVNQNSTTWEKAIDADTFLEFLGSYHASKWEENSWYDVEGCLRILYDIGKVDVKDLEYPDDWNKEQMTKFCKYLGYQYSQYFRGKNEIRLAYELYQKVYHKKTRNISTQTEVSLSPNKKYFTNKC